MCLVVFVGFVWSLMCVGIQGCSVFAFIRVFVFRRFFIFSKFLDIGDAHIKRQIMGREVTVAITNGQLDFGPWEQIFYGEFDGWRRKPILIKVIGE